MTIAFNFCRWIELVLEYAHLVVAAIVVNILRFAASIFCCSLVGSCLLDIAWLWFTGWKLMNPSFFKKKIPNIVSMVSAMVSAMVFQQGLFNYFQ